MIVFVDESGDPGLKIKQGSSRYFVIAVIIFEEEEEMKNCDQRIELLKKEIHFHFKKEFKFHNTDQQQRKAFFEAILPYNFFYHGIVINKDPTKLTGDGFKVKESFYKYASSLVFENAKPILKNATVIFDGSGSRDFKKQFKNYLKKKIGNEINKVQMWRSESSNLVQMADMIAGAIHRSFQKNKGDSGIYREIINMKELRVQVWPPERP